MKKSRKKKLQAFLLTFCMAVSALPWGVGTEQTIYAGEGGLGDSSGLLESVNLEGVVYKEIEPGKMQLVEWGQEIAWNATVTIPETVTFDGNEYTVVSIGDRAFYDKQTMAGVIFPDTILSIGESAFDNCTRLGRLELPPDLKEIGRSAFYRCYALSGELVIPVSVTSIGMSAFSYCTKLESVKILNPDISYGGYEFSQDSSLVHITLPEGMTSLGSSEQGNMLYDCKKLVQIDLPESLTEIPKGTLYGCAALTEIHIPTSVKKIGASAFMACTGLREISIPEGVTEILSQTFCNCSEELCVIFPDSITSVHNWAFWNNSAGQNKYSTTVTAKCTSREVAVLVAGIGHKKILLNGEPYELDEFTTEQFKYLVTDKENRLVQVEKRADVSLSGEIVIPETVEWEGNTYTVTSIASNGFWCSDVTKVTLPETITSIGKNAFMSCAKLESINLPDGITRIEQETFHACHALKDITLPSNLKQIGSLAFKECESLTKIEIPESCTVVTEAAFWDCTGLTEVKLHEGLKELGNNIFRGCTGLTEIHLPDSLEKLGTWVFFGCTELSKIDLSQSLTEIGQGVFEGCEKLTGTMILPDSVTTIRRDAFVENGLTEIRVGENLIILESGAFPDSIRLTTYNPQVYNLLVKNTGRTGESAPVLLWDGRHDTLAGMHAYAEEDVIVTENIVIKNGAVVTVLPGVSVTLAEGASVTIENGGRLEISEDASVTIAEDAAFMIEEGGMLETSENSSVTVNGTLTNNGTIEGDGELTVNGTLTGTGSFGGNMYVTMPLTEEMVADAEDAVYSVTPASPEPEVSAVLGGNKIVFEKDTDFTYSYANNTKPGRADVTVTPKTGGRLTGNPVTKHFTILKANQAAPKEWTLTFEENADKKTFTAVITAIEGAEYSFDGETWSEQNKKSDCQPETEYTAYIRMQETETHLASPIAETTAAAPKITQTVIPEKELEAPDIKALKAAAGKTGVSVQIEVNPVANADRYEIYRVAGGKTTPVKTTESGKTVVQDENPQKSAKYYAVAVSRDGRFKSRAGNSKTITFSKETKMKKVSAVSNGIKVSWKKIKNAKKYVLYRSTKKNAGYTKVKTLGKKKLSYIDKKAKKGKNYYYKIVVLTKTQPSLMSKASKKVKRK